MPLHAVRLLIYLWFVSLSVVSAFGQSPPERLLLKDYYEKKAKKYLLRSTLDDYDQLAFKAEGLYCYPDSIAKRMDQPTFFMAWKDLPKLKECFEAAPFDTLYQQFLAGEISTVHQPIQTSKDSPDRKIKIAIDPGHLATNFQEAVYEEKYIEFYDGKIRFYEADLNVTTALLLQKKLEKKGFEVFLSRTKDKPDAWNLGFEQWKATRFEATLAEALKNEELTEEQVQWFKGKATTQQIFKYLYVRFELKERAKIINDYDPDITIIIHYNGGGKSVTTPTDKNVMMTFVPGAFLKNELKKPIDRFEFLRLLTTDQIERSIRLSDKFIRSFHRLSNIPIAKAADAAYLEKWCLATSARGVFARNLAMTRLVHTPLVFGEPLYQDSKKMVRSLNKHHPDKKRKRPSKWVKRAAKAYYRSALSYLEEMGANNIP